MEITADITDYSCTLDFSDCRELKVIEIKSTGDRGVLNINLTNCNELRILTVYTPFLLVNITGKETLRNIKQDNICSSSHEQKPIERKELSSSHEQKPVERKELSSLSWGGNSNLPSISYSEFMDFTLLAGIMFLGMTPLVVVATEDAAAVIYAGVVIYVADHRVQIRLITIGFITAYAESFWGYDHYLTYTNREDKEEKDEKKPEEKKLTLVDDTEAEDFEKYYQALKKAVMPNELASLDQILSVNRFASKHHQRQVFTPLFQLKAGQDSFKINASIVKYLTETGCCTLKQHLYIDGPKDFSYFLSPGKIDQDKKQLGIEHNGPLRKLLAKDKSTLKVLVINWSNFSPRERTAYQSLLDNPPYITIENETLSVPENVKVIGVIDECVAMNCGKSFLSRSQRWTLPESFFTSHATDEKMRKTKKNAAPGSGSPEEPDGDNPLGKEEKQLTPFGTEKKLPAPVKLHKNPLCEPKIVGEIKFIGQEVRLTPGPLLQSIEENSPLPVFEDPPKSPYNRRFELLQHEVNDQRKIMSLTEGDFIPVPSNVFIRTQAWSRLTATPENVHISFNNLTDSKLEEYEKIYLSVHNLHECYKRTIINNKDKTTTTDRHGLLAQYKPGHQIFYITDHIPNYFWQELMEEISTTYSHIEFHFILAPSASIEGVREFKTPMLSSKSEEKKGREHKEEKPIPKDEKSKPIYFKEKEKKLESKASEEDLNANVYVSNDPLYLTQKLEEAEKKSGNDPWIVSIHPQTTFNELIFLIFRTPLGEFNLQEKAILQALIEGRTVIARGEPSLAVYTRLLSLLDEKSPYVYMNGNRFKIKGKLILVMPQHAKERLSLLKVKECCYGFKDYFVTLQESLLPNDIEHLKQIELFYEKAFEYPHRGQGQPVKPYLSFERVRTMLRALAKPNKWHQHNPIENIFNIDYPRGSTIEAYFNVMGKAIFRATDNTPHDRDKLKNVIKLHNIKTDEDIHKYGWHLVDCFYGAQLKEIIGKNFEYITRDNSGMPAFRLDIVIRLRNYIKNSSYEQKAQMTALLSKEIKLERSLLDDEKKDEKKLDSPSPIKKQDPRDEELEFYLNNDDTPLIILHGPAGTGKTHAVRKKMGAGNYYEGEADIPKWLEKGGTLFFDEFNDAAPGTKDFLQGLSQQGSKKKITYKASKDDDYKTYNLTPKHKVIGSCNPVGLRYPGRSYHEVSQNSGVAIYFDEPTDEFLTKEIINPLLHKAQFRQLDEKLLDERFLYAYHLVKEYNPHIVRSIRDMKRVVERFLFLAKKEDLLQETKDEVKVSEFMKEQHPIIKKLLGLLLDVCVTEFASSIPNINQRAEFVNKLRLKFYMEPLRLPHDEQKECKLIQLTEDVAIPETKRYLVDAIEQDLEMRLDKMLQRALKQTKNKEKEVKEEQSEPDAEDHQSIIVQGEPGLGKSTYIRAIVKRFKNKLKQKVRLRVGSSPGRPLSPEEILFIDECQKVPAEISGGSADPLGELTKALHEENIVIEDESNINEETDKLLSEFLSGADERRQPVYKPGFMHIGSQNSSAHEERPGTSQSKINRVHFLHMDDFNDAELKAFAKNKNLRNPAQYVSAYRKICEEYPDATMRTFHEVSKNLERSQKDLVERSQKDLVERSQKEKAAAQAIRLRYYRKIGITAENPEDKKRIPF